MQVRPVFIVEITMETRNGIIGLLGSAWIQEAAESLLCLNKTELKLQKCKLLYMKRSKATPLVYKYDPGVAQASLNVKDPVGVQVK